MPNKLQEAEAKIVKLRKALVGLVGASTQEELKLMETALAASGAPDAYKAAAINGVHALLDTVEYSTR